jgi:hypothetical protein
MPVYRVVLFDEYEGTNRHRPALVFLKVSIDYLLFDFMPMIRFRQVNQVCGKFRYRIVLAELNNIPVYFPKSVKRVNLLLILRA